MYLSQATCQAIQAYLQGAQRIPTDPLWLYPDGKPMRHEMISTTMIYAKVQDATVETDYRQALHKIEQRQMPFSEQPVSVDEWPTQVVNVQESLDNSV